MKHHNKKILSYIITTAVIAVAALWVGNKFIHLGNIEFTDNAQVRQQIVPVNSRVQGYIKEIRFREYAKVKKGDTLVIIDDADMRLNVARANADYQNALAGRSVADRSVASASANVAVSEASIAEAKVLMENAATDLTRYEKLLAQDAVTHQQYDGAKTDYEAKRARYEMLVRQCSATSSVVDVNRQRMSQSEAGIKLAKALLETAELNLSYTVIIAPCDGYTSHKEIQVGTTGADPSRCRRFRRYLGYGKLQGNPASAHYPRQQSRSNGRCHSRSGFQRRSECHLNGNGGISFPYSPGQFCRQFRKSASAHTRKNRIRAR